MRRTWAFFLIVFTLFSGLSLHAQEEEQKEDIGENPSVESDWDGFISEPYSRGDKTFSIILGVLIPTYFSGVENNEHGISLGGVGSLAFNYFITSRIFFGAEISGSFSATRGHNMLYLVPFGVRGGYQFWYRRFEIPINLFIGAAPQKYLEKGYFELIVKPGASFFWRYSPEWSFGLNGNWWFLPQWPKNGYNANGNFLELTFAVRYNF
jgi:hypothetical protein